MCWGQVQRLSINNLWIGCDIVYSLNSPATFQNDLFIYLQMTLFSKKLKFHLYIYIQNVQGKSNKYLQIYVGCSAITINSEGFFGSVGQTNSLWKYMRNLLQLDLKQSGCLVRRELCLNFNYQIRRKNKEGTKGNYRWVKRYRVKCPAVSCGQYPRRECLPEGEYDCHSCSSWTHFKCESHVKDKNQSGANR